MERIAGSEEVGIGEVEELDVAHRISFRGGPLADALGELPGVGEHAGDELAGLGWCVDEHDVFEAALDLGPLALLSSVGGAA